MLVRLPKGSLVTQSLVKPRWCYWLAASVTPSPAVSWTAFQFNCLDQDPFEKHRINLLRKEAIIRNFKFLFNLRVTGRVMSFLQSKTTKRWLIPEWCWTFITLQSKHQTQFCSSCAQCFYWKGAFEVSTEGCGRWNQPWIVCGVLPPLPTNYWQWPNSLWRGLLMRSVGLLICLAS